MSRPFIQKRIDELEAMFNTDHCDADFLTKLEAELGFRSVPRAAALLVNVRGALRGNIVIPIAKQSVLFEHQSVRPVQVLLPNAVSESAAATQETVFRALSLEDAYKALNLTSSASWEAIETSRRGLVDRARPDKIAALKGPQREGVKREASLVNAAYSVLAKARVKSTASL
jgi:hypothetical protein